MSDIRFNQWLHQSGTGGVSQVASGAVGVGTTNPLADFYVRGDAQITGILTAGHIAMGSSITFGDNDRIYLGDGTDFQLYHASSDNNSYIVESGAGSLVVNASKFHVKNAANNEDVAVFNQSGNNELYFSNSKKFETTNTGAVVTGILTATTFSGSIAASNINSGTVATARLGSGTANSSTFLRGDQSWAAVTSTTINNNANNRIITGSGTANTLEGEANLTYNGSALALAGNDNQELKIGAGADLTLKADGSNSAIVHNGDGDLVILAQGSSENIKLQSAGYLHFFTSGNNERLRINNVGHVFIGNSTNNTNDNAFFKAHAADGEADDLYVGQFINSEATAGRNYGVNIQGGSNSTDHGFRVRNHGGSTQFLVKGDGNIGINETAPEELLHITHASAPAIQLEATAGGPYKSLIKMGGNDMEIRGSSGQMEFYTGNADGDSSTERLRIKSGGDVEVKTGNLVIGTSGKGIDFSATGHTNPTGDGEVLTTYEEGTWTPQPMFSGANTGMSFSADGYYVRVGKMVSCYYQVIFTNKGSATGDFQIGGFPFSNSITEFTNPGFGYFHRLSFSESSDHVITCNLSGTTSSWRRAQYGSGVHNMATVTHSNINSSTHLAGSLIYRTS